MRRIYQAGMSIGFFTLFGVLSACTYKGPTANVAPLPTHLHPTITPTIIPPAVEPTVPVVMEIPSPTPAPTSPCTPDLKYIDDITIEDYSIVLPGSLLDKQWLVQNTGTCNWDVRYRFRQTSGVDMGVRDQALYPALSGKQVILQVILTAPLDPGVYTSVWRPVEPGGSYFGDMVTLTITVQSP